MFPCWWLVNDWVWFTDLQFYLYLSKFKIFIKVHKSFNVQFSSEIKIFIKVQVFHQSSSFSSKLKFFTKVQVFHQSSSFSSKFKFFIKVHKMLVSNVDLKKCQIQVFEIMDFLKCSRASQWHSVLGCTLCKRVSPKRNAQKNILKNPLFKFQCSVFIKVKVFHHSSSFSS